MMKMKKKSIWKKPLKNISNVKEWWLNAKQKTKRVNNIHWFKGEIKKKKSNISQKNLKLKPKKKEDQI
jgi:hypothetical protein